MMRVSTDLKVITLKIFIKSNYPNLVDFFSNSHSIYLHSVCLCGAAWWCSGSTVASQQQGPGLRLFRVEFVCSLNFWVGFLPQSKDMQVKQVKWRI